MHAALALALVSVTNVEGSVVAQHSRWEGGLIVTESTLQLDGTSDTVSVRQLGGTIDGIAQVAFGEDTLPAGVGEHVAVRLQREGTTWFVAGQGEHAAYKSESSGTTASTPGYVRAMTDINKSCGTTDPQPLHWPDLETHYVLDQDPPDGISREEAEASVRASFDTWAGVDCSYFKLDFDGQVDHPAIGYQSHDNVNAVTYVEHDWQGKSSTQAITLLTFGCKDGVILDADVLVNADDFRYTTDPEDDHTGRRDLQNVLTHEAGHFVGFAHSPDPLSTMFATVTADETQKRDLTDSDRAGMCVAYPADRGPLAAEVSPAVPGCQVARTHGGGFGAGLAVLALFAGAGLKSRRRRSNREA